MNTKQRIIVVLLVSSVYLPLNVMSNVEAFGFGGGQSCTSTTYQWRDQGYLYLRSDYEVTSWDDLQIIVMKSFFDTSFPNSLTEENYFLEVQHSQSHGNVVLSNIYARMFRQYRVVIDPSDGSICIGPGQSGWTNNARYDLVNHVVGGWTQDKFITFSYNYATNSFLDSQTESLLDSAMVRAKQGKTVDCFDRYRNSASQILSGAYLKNGMQGTIGNDAFSISFWGSKTTSSSFNFVFSIGVTNNDAAGLVGGRVEVSVGASIEYTYFSTDATTEFMEMSYGINHPGDGLPVGHAYTAKVFSLGPGIGAYYSSYA